jgi:hypothetical protein
MIIEDQQYGTIKREGKYDRTSSDEEAVAAELVFVIGALLFRLFASSAISFSADLSHFSPGRRLVDLVE